MTRRYTNPRLPYSTDVSNLKPKKLNEENEKRKKKKKNVYTKT